MTSAISGDRQSVKGSNRCIVLKIKVSGQSDIWLKEMCMNHYIRPLLLLLNDIFTPLTEKLRSYMFEEVGVN
jgi:hypothetical protein